MFDNGRCALSSLYLCRFVTRLRANRDRGSSNLLPGLRNMFWLLQQPIWRRRSEREVHRQMRLSESDL